MRSTYILAVLMLSVLPALIRADAVCGPNARFIVALTCGDGTTYLHCAPNSLKTKAEFCTNPNNKWSAAKCIGRGYVSLNLGLTGCYTMDPAFWATYAGVTVSGDLCDALGIPVTTLTIPNDNMGFESGLTGWTVPDINTPGSVYVQCDDRAAEGSCFAVVSGQSKESPDVNALYRDIKIASPGGCGSNMQQLSFQYRFLSQDGGYYNDYIRVVVTDKTTDVSLLNEVTDTVAVGGVGGDSGWMSRTVNLGSLAAGQELTVQLKLESTNQGDDMYASAGLLDDVKVVTSA